MRAVKGSQAPLQERVKKGRSDGRNWNSLVALLKVQDVGARGAGYPLLFGMQRVMTRAVEVNPATLPDSSSLGPFGGEGGEIEGLHRQGGNNEEHTVIRRVFGKNCGTVCRRGRLACRRAIPATVSGRYGGDGSVGLDRRGLPVRQAASLCSRSGG